MSVTSREYPGCLTGSFMGREEQEVQGGLPAIIWDQIPGESLEGNAALAGLATFPRAASSPWQALPDPQEKLEFVQLEKFGIVKSLCGKEGNTVGNAMENAMGNARRNPG